MAKDKVTQRAEELFKTYPEVDKLYYTDDHNFFLPRAKGYAQTHAKKYGLKVHEISRNQGSSTDNGAYKIDPDLGVDIAGMTNKEVEQWASGIDSVELLGKALTIVEKKGAKTAIEERIEKLGESENENHSTGRKSSEKEEDPEFRGNTPQQEETTGADSNDQPEKE